jgi:hypothetical protein
MRAGRQDCCCVGLDAAEMGGGMGERGGRFVFC